MSTSDRLSITQTLAGIGAAALIASISTTALAGTTEALAGCKTEIAGDQRLTGFESVAQNTGEIKRRGRYTYFEIKVRAESADGSEAAWMATCKARSTGKVEELELVQLGGSGAPLVAQTDNQ